MLQFSGFSDNICLSNFIRMLISPSYQTTEDFLFFCFSFTRNRCDIVWLFKVLNNLSYFLRFEQMISRDSNIIIYSNQLRLVLNIKDDWAKNWQAVQHIFCRHYIELVVEVNELIVFKNRALSLAFFQCIFHIYFI